VCSGFRRVDDAEADALKSLALSDELRDRAGRIFGLALSRASQLSAGNSSLPDGSGAQSRMPARRSAAGDVTVKRAKPGFARLLDRTLSGVAQRAGR
jgi:hypothetical protein